MALSAAVLETQIENARQKISSDGYPMSIGELTNLYRSKELIVRPEFQRYFRWTNVQKSRLVESVLLGIPIPSIFVAQTDDGKWELVDGLQRVCTLLELQGELLNEQGKRQPMLVLEPTSYLPALRGRQWISTKASETLSEAQRLDVKRAKLDIKIIKRESSPQAKYDLFQRLNSYGTPLTNQEIRSSLLSAVSSDFLFWLTELAKYPAFVEAVSLSERQIEEKFDLELVTRFVVLHNKPTEEFTPTQLRDLRLILDDSIVGLAKSSRRQVQKLDTTFKETFDFLYSELQFDVFRRWDASKKVFKGPFTSTAFEVFGLGIGYHISNGSSYRSRIAGAVKTFWQKSNMISGYSTGRSTESRLSETVPLGREMTAR